MRIGFAAVLKASNKRFLRGACCVRLKKTIDKLPGCAVSSRRWALHSRFFQPRLGSTSGSPSGWFHALTFTKLRHVVGTMSSASSNTILWVGSASPAPSAPLLAESFPN